MTMKALLKTAFAVSVLGFAGATYAAPCGTGLDTTNMTINGESADACHGPFTPTNSSPAQLQAYLNTNNVFGGGWDHVVRDESPGGGTSTGDTVMGIQFSLNAVGNNAGTFTLTLTDTNGATPLNLPAMFDLVGVLKASTSSAAYFFDDIVLGANNAGTYTIAFENDGGNFPALSHMDFLVRDGRTPPTNGVPEPASVGLLGIGILAAAMARRRRKQGA